LSKDIAISVRGLSKSYTIQHNAAKHTTAAEALLNRLRHPFARSEQETFWALKDVEFDIEQGDVVGVIGRNGAGKSTLLKILSRITEPTTGEIDLYGRVGSLLEVGTGFHSELTGRENIYLNGAILGMSKREIARQFDAIVDFSGVEQFLDTPVKRYSSGMYVRLAFAVAAHLSSEILIVDEVLAVGDAEFQRKCLGKMKDMAGSGRTVLFVSHNMAAVSNLCSSCLVMQRGRVCFAGNVEQGLDYYSASMNASGGTQGPIQQFRPSWAKPYITSLRLLNEEGKEQTHFPLGSDVVVEMEFCSPTFPLRSPVMGVVINHMTNGTVGGVNMRMTGDEIPDGEYAAATIRCLLKELPLLQGQYTMDIWLGDGAGDVDNVSGYLTLHLEETDIYGSGKVPFHHMGVIFFKPEWKLRTEVGGQERKCLVGMK